MLFVEFVRSSFLIPELNLKSKIRVFFLIFFKCYILYLVSMWMEIPFWKASVCVLPSILGCCVASENDGGKEACGPKATWVLAECPHHWPGAAVLLATALCGGLSDADWALITLTTPGLSGALPGNSRVPCDLSDLSQAVGLCGPVFFLGSGRHIGVELSHTLTRSSQARRAALGVGMSLHSPDKVELELRGITQLVLRVSGRGREGW